MACEYGTNTVALSATHNRRFVQQELFAGLELVIAGKVERKARFYFNVYDIDGSGQVDIDEVEKLIVLAGKGGRNHRERTHNVARVMRKLDKDGDGTVTCGEFVQACKEDPTMLECFGTLFGSADGARSRTLSGFSTKRTGAHPHPNSLAHLCCGAVLNITESPMTQQKGHGLHYLTREVDNINMLFEGMHRHTHPSKSKRKKHAKRRVSLPELNPLARRFISMGHSDAIHRLKSFRRQHDDYLPLVSNINVRVHPPV